MLDGKRKFHEDAIHLHANGKTSCVANLDIAVSGMALSCDKSLLYICAIDSRFIHAFKIFPDGSLDYMYPFARLHIADHAAYVGATSISESIGFMFQQTARYVNTYPDELSPEEEAVLAQNFQSMENFKEYDPQFIDPIKRFYNHSAPNEYFALWFRQLIKHPGVYVGSYLNGAFGYLAPVAADAGAWIMTDYSGYLKDRMGVEHKGSEAGPDILIALRNPSERQIFIRYFTYPGLYTWCLVFLLYLLGKGKKKGAWVPFVPALMTLFVCTVSPLACAMRYALLAAASAPVLAGWTAAVLRKAPEAE